MIKKIYTILVLLCNFLVRRKHYRLKFLCEEDSGVRRWYYAFRGWGFEHGNLEMVSGADTLCDHHSTDGGKTAVVNVIASRKPIRCGNGKYDHFVGEDFPEEWNIKDRLIWGRNYYNELYPNEKFWICPVTLFVLGRYPKHLYIEVKEKQL